MRETTHNHPPELLYGNVFRLQGTPPLHSKSQVPDEEQSRRLRPRSRRHRRRGASVVGQVMFLSSATLLSMTLGGTSLAFVGTP